MALPCIQELVRYCPRTPSRFDHTVPARTLYSSKRLSLMVPNLKGATSGHRVELIHHTDEKSTPTVSPALCTNSSLELFGSPPDAISTTELPPLHCLVVALEPLAFGVPLRVGVSGAACWYSGLCALVGNWLNNLGHGSCEERSGNGFGTRLAHQRCLLVLKAA